MTGTEMAIERAVERIADVSRRSVPSVASDLRHVIDHLADPPAFTLTLFGRTYGARTRPGRPGYELTCLGKTDAVLETLDRLARDA